MTMKSKKKMVYFELFGAYITLIKWKALATDPQAVKQVALGQIAGNTFSNIFGPRRV